MTDPAQIDTLTSDSGLRIARMDAIPVEVPWSDVASASSDRAYKWAFGVKRSGAAVLVRIETDDGHVGWGEATCLFHPAMPASILESVIGSLRPLVLGQRITDIRRILGLAYNQAGWHFARGIANYAFSGIEMALWDAIGKAAAMPLCDLIGGRVRDRVEFMYFVYRDDVDAMRTEAVRAVENGYRCIYVKVGIKPAEDVEIVRALRDAIGPDAQLRVDANESWSPAMAVRMITEMADCGLEFVEQPVLASDLQGMANVRQRVSTPICADQSARTPHKVLDVVRFGCADVLSFCPGDAGGILAATQAASIAEAAGLPVFVHSNIELGLATAAHVHLAAAVPNCHYASQTELQFLSGDVLVDGELAWRGAHIDVPAGPGLGVRVDDEKVREHHERYRHASDGAQSVAPPFVSHLPGY